MTNHDFSGIFDKIESDDRLTPSDLSIYIVLLNHWCKNEFKNPIIISRREILLSSKVKSIATYHKCLKGLNDFGYIKYTPSYNPYKASTVEITDFRTEKSPEIYKLDQQTTTPDKEIIIRVSLHVSK